MNREIKFRIWFKSYKEFDYFDLSEMIESCDGYAGNCHEDFILQQFTGLLDKNGREIYEGDIYSTGDGISFYVMWDRNGYVLFRYTGQIMENVGAVVDTIDLFGNTHLIYKGNICENPELLPSMGLKSLYQRK